LPPLLLDQPQLLDSDTVSSHPPEKTLTTLKVSGKETGLDIELPTQMTKTAQSVNPTTGRVPNNALNHGNAEVPDSVKEADGAQDMTDVRELHFQTKPQVLLLTAEHYDSATK
jgi:hypothetical protein